MGMANVAAKAPRRHAVPAPRTDAEPSAEQLLAELAQTPPRSEEARRLRERIIDRYRPQISREVRRYSNRGVPEDDVRQVALVGVLNAIRGFDPQYGKPFISYLLPTMTGEIKRYFRDNTWAVRTPRAHQENRSELNRFTAEFGQSHGRSPSTAEIGEHFGLGIEATNEMLCACSAYSALSLDRPCGEGENGEERLLGDTISVVDKELELVVNRDALKSALARLPERERRILLLRFFGEKTQVEIADKMGLSQMHISRLLTSTLASLQRDLVTS